MGSGASKSGNATRSAPRALPGRAPGAAATQPSVASAKTGRVLPAEGGPAVGAVTAVSEPSDSEPEPPLPLQPVVGNGMKSQVSRVDSVRYGAAQASLAVPGDSG